MIHLNPEDIYKDIAKKLSLAPEQVEDAIKLTFKKIRNEISNFNRNTDKPPIIAIPNIGRFVPTINKFEKLKQIQQANDNKTNTDKV